MAVTPSNANTSGLEVVAWEYRFRDTGLWHRTESASVAEDERKDGSEVRPYAVTAASAQARIDAEKARADRLAKALEPFAAEHECDGHATVEDFNMEVQIFVRWAVIKAARAALQQETQP